MSDPARTLAIETATEACSIALVEGHGPDARIIAHDHRILGRGHAEALVPMIAALPDRGRAARIAVSLGPGSFTGVRIGIATARALGVAWGAKVMGYPTLALIAAMARDKSKCDEVTVCMNAGHGEWFVQNFVGGLAQSNARSLSPEAARAERLARVVAGSRAQELAEEWDGDVETLSMLPDARSVLLLPDDCLRHDLDPIYGRAPDAKPQAIPDPHGSTLATDSQTR